MIIDKGKYPNVFVPNDDLNIQDILLFEEVLSKALQPHERTFFENMKKKEEGEFAPSADIIMDEHNNASELYLIRYYYSEYKIGRGLPGHKCSEAIYNDTLADTLKANLFQLLGRHITLWEWLKENDFQGIEYSGNYILMSSKHD
jgi:hypothetical protein